jgi:hypothetical protein
MNDNEDLLDTITRQRLTIYHQERRIEALEKSLYQATQMNPNDLINQAFIQLQTSNALTASKLRIEQLEKQNAELIKRGGLLCQVILDLSNYAPENAITKAVILEAIENWNKARDVR